MGCINNPKRKQGHQEILADSSNTDHTKSNHKIIVDERLPPRVDQNTAPPIQINVEVPPE